jgi:hypothetical protein
MLPMRNAERRYRWLARFWGHCFVVAGLLFAIVPDRVVDLLVWEGSLLGLRGDMHFGQDSLSWALALSLMAVLVLLSYQSAARPRDPGPYRALLLSKLTSTAVFLYLATQYGPVWVLAASTDFFVAVTLFAARLSIPDAGPATGFAGRYLGWMGVNESGRDHYTRMVAQLPTAARAAVRFANAFFTWLGPLLLLGRPRRATSLNEAGMERMVASIRASRSPLVRMMWILLHQPACSVLATARCGAGQAAPARSALPILAVQPVPAE